MNTNLYLVRHGESVLNAAGRVQGSQNDGDHNTLSPQGVLQAQKLSLRLHAIPFACVYSSPSKRTMETASHVCQGRKIALLNEPNLREKEIGSLAGLTHTEFYSRYAGWDDKTEDERLDMKVVADEESQRELRLRVISTLTQIAKRHLKSSVLVVTHGGFMRSFYQYIKKIPFREMWAFENCGYMIVDYTKGAFHIRETNGLLSINPDKIK